MSTVKPLVGTLSSVTTGIFRKCPHKTVFSDKMDTLNFVIVGHVDHGKSTLIGRLLYDTDSLPPDKIEEIKKASEGLGRKTEFAYLLDHLEEERQQGITIDTTQVFFKANKRNYVIIDAPGHVEFVKNMITGASQAEAAILIIDASEGIKEQTKRHAYILSLLGLSQVIVAMNKMDLVDFKEERFNEVREGLRGFLDSIGIDALFYIPMCAIKGDNVLRRSKNTNWYKGPTLVESLDTLKTEESAEDKSLILPVQDAYKIDDKRIVVGKLEAGVADRKAEIKILPRDQRTKIDSIEKYLKNNVGRAYAGESIGIVTQDDVFLNRGDIICLPGKEPVLTDRFSANIFWMAKYDFRIGDRMIIRCATQETTCKVENIRKRINTSSLAIIQENAEILKNLEVGEVTIKTKKPIAIMAFSDLQELGRFVFVKGENICAGGIITTAT